MVRASSLLPSFVIYMIAMVGETNRAPFDLPEAEGELVGGFHTEYSSLKFALFFLAEYINMATVSALATTLFLGGWHAPWPIVQIWAGANEGYWPLIWFFGKVLFFIFIFIWLRGSLPRLRYDQFMAFGWKRLIPVSLVWIVAVATIRAITLDGGIDRSLAADRRSACSPCSSWSCPVSASADDEDEAEPRRRRRRSGQPVPRCPPAMPAGGAPCRRLPRTSTSTATGRRADGRR